MEIMAEMKEPAAFPRALRYSTTVLTRCPFVMLCDALVMLL
jgi:hypothetical protein